MNLKKIKPITPASRNLIKIYNKELSKKPFLKNKIAGLKNNSGRNKSGKITVRHIGGGHKQKYRKINYLRTANFDGIVTSLEYDPNRSSNIAAIYDYTQNSYEYILATKNLKIGDIVKAGINADVKNGHSLPLSKIPVGSLINSISPETTVKSKITRSAGTFSQLIEKTTKHARIKLSSGEQRRVSVNCFATIGIISNENFFLTTVGKAGRSRWLNKRPKVRGVAMNPIDHPHGGGEGKTSGGKSSVTPWGKPTKGGKTSRSRNKFILK